LKLSFDRLWVVLALGLPALLSLLVAMPAVDLAYQVRAGDEILASGALPGVDTWTFTIAGTPWLDQQWLAQVLLSVFHGIGGWELLGVVRAGLVVVALGLLLAAMVELGVKVRIAAILVLVAFLLAAPALALRPQLFAIAIFCAFLWMVTTRWWHPTLYLFMPVLVILWANVHGSFVLVPLILGFALLDDIACSRGWRRSAIELVVGTAATLINPFGIGVWTYAANIGSDPIIRDMVSEWQHTSPLTVPGLLFYASLAGTLAFMVVRSRHKGHVLVSDWLWVGGFAFVAVWAERGLAWWPFAAAYTVATLIGRIPAPREQRQRPRTSRLNGVLAAGLGILVLVALPWWRPSDPLTGRQGLLSYAPSGLAASLEASTAPDARVFTQQTWASWFEWAVPDGRYFLDSRFELFPGSVFTDYDVISKGGDAALAKLDGWGVGAVVVAGGAPLAATLDGAGWRRAYADADGVVFVHDGGD